MDYMKLILCTWIENLACFLKIFWQDMVYNIQYSLKTSSGPLAIYGGRHPRHVGQTGTPLLWEVSNLAPLLS